MSSLLYFKERRRRPVVTVLDKHVRKTNQMILAAHLMHTSTKTQLS